VNISVKEAEVAIKNSIHVTEQLVTFAKAFLLNLDGIGPYDAKRALVGFADSQGYRLPDKVVLHPSVDSSLSLTQTSGYISCAMAFTEATWSLIYNGYFWHLGIYRESIEVQWTTVIPGQGGSSGGWTFTDFQYELPAQIVKAPSKRETQSDNLTDELPAQIVKAPSKRETQSDNLTDPDIFMHNTSIENADLEIKEAISDAVLCFKNGLYRAAVTMLGKAMEGMWIEVGCSIVKASIQSPDKKDKAIQKLQDDSGSVPSKIKMAADLYKNRDLCGHIIGATEINPNLIDRVILWSNVLREARNAIHFGVKPTLPNSYEKVSVLLIDGATNFSLMYRIKHIADTLNT